MTATTSIFDQILAGVREDVAAREARVSFQEIKARSRDVEPARDAMASLTVPGCAVIAEIKRATPLKGDIAVIDSPAELGKAFESSGAALIGCQTESRRFRGSLEDLAAVKAAVSVPVMCKDFIVDPYQIHEARVFGADMVPLLVSALEQNHLEALMDRVHSLGMTALVEVQTPEEASRAVAAGAKVIGVNARNLRTMTLDRQAFATIAPGLPRGVVRIALSGVRTAQDLMAYAGAGADAVVVGEELVKSDNPAGTCRKLVAAGKHPSCPSDF